MKLTDIYGEKTSEKEFFDRLEKLKSTFYKGEGSFPDLIYSSSGRAEILGNHTDHNCGKVLVSAISCDILAVVKKTENGKIKICSDGFSSFTVAVDDLWKKDDEVGTSIALTRGVAKKIVDEGNTIGGFTAYMSSTVFKGAGVSSSAAFEVLIAEIINDLYLGGKLTPFEKAKISKYSENEYFGKPCGLLDQSGIAMGSLTYIDFENSESPRLEKLKMPKGYSLVITNTGGNHASLTKHYASIRSEMEEVAKFFGKKVLREVPFDTFYSKIPELTKKVSSRAILRALHFYNENERVEKAVNALKKKNVKEFLTAVNESGLSSLNCLQNCAVPGDTNQPVVLGIELSRKILKGGAVRVHGGGFAGSILAIVKNSQTNYYVKEMKKVFGEENVSVASVRLFGTTKIQ